MSLLPEKYSQAGSQFVPPGSILVRTESGLQVAKSAGSVSAVSAPAAPASAPAPSSPLKWLLLGGSLALIVALGREGRK